MKLTILGCTGSMSGPTSPSSSYLLQAQGLDDDGKPREYSLVMDLGSGAMGQMLAHLDPARLDAVLFSHLHADHCVDIVGLHVYRKWHPNGRLPQIPVYGPGDVRSRTRAIDGGEPDNQYTAFDFVDVQPGSSFDVGPMHIEVFEAYHTIPAVAFRVTGPSEDPDKGDVVLTYSGDTDVCEGVAQAARNVDFFLCEAAFEDGRDPYRGVHLNGQRAGELAAGANVSRLVLTHLQPWTDPEIVMAHAAKEYSGDISCARAGEVYEV
ncbi:MAG: MBL fold metallo-hydrolase [Actinomycetaceae bacterium]|nr:MBL fold metallo-hydrolase [Actinomycetaceae bacterium]